MQQKCPPHQSVDQQQIGSVVVQNSPDANDKQFSPSALLHIKRSGNSTYRINYQ